MKATVRYADHIIITFLFHVRAPAEKQQDTHQASKCAREIKENERTTHIVEKKLQTGMIEKEWCFKLLNT